MSAAPDRRQLRGLPLAVAELYGKPHIGARYRSGSIRSHAMEPGARCAVCRRPATNVHHAPPVSKGPFRLVTPAGSWELRPALVALCGSGTTGCHDGFHGGGRFEIRWVWDSDDAARAWWDGSLLAELEPHDPAIYGLGRWEIRDRLTGGALGYRGKEACHGRWRDGIHVNHGR